MREGNNAPDFDPIEASPQEEREMMDGYLAAWRREIRPQITSPAFDHGWRMASNDRAGVVDDDQHAFARRWLARQRAALSQPTPTTEDKGREDA